jgi:hypothetical protein
MSAPHDGRFKMKRLNRTGEMKKAVVKAATRKTSHFEGLAMSGLRRIRFLISVFIIIIRYKI